MDGENTVDAPLAGYEHIAFARFDAEICIGRTLDEAVEFAVALGPAGEHVSRRWSEQGQVTQAEVDRRRAALGR